MAHDVFISYSSQDRTTANAVCATLEGMGIRCWIAPRDVVAGTNYAESLVDAIHGSQLMVLVLSSRSNGSPHVLREVERAVSSGLPIVPLRTEDVPLSKSMEHYISSVHWLDAFPPPQNKHLKRLGETVQSILSRNAPTDSINSSVSQATQTRGFLSTCLLLCNRRRVALLVGLFILTFFVVAFLLRNSLKSDSRPAIDAHDHSAPSANGSLAAQPADVSHENAIGEFTKGEASPTHTRPSVDGHDRGARSENSVPVAEPPDVVSENASSEFTKGKESPTQGEPEAIVSDPGAVENAIAALKKMGGQVQRDERNFVDRPVISVVLSGEYIPDASAAYLKPLTSTTSLSLGKTRITDAGLVHLSGMTKLEHLDLTSTGIKGSGLQYLKSASGLRTLKLTFSPLTDAGLRHLTGMSELSLLQLKGTQITDAGLEHLSGLTKLEWLYLGYTEITDAGLEHLKGLTNLHMLELDHTRVTDAGLKHLKGLTDLQFLMVNGTDVTSSGVEELRKTVLGLNVQGVRN